MHYIGRAPSDIVEIGRLISTVTPFVSVGAYSWCGFNIVCTIEFVLHCLAVVVLKKIKH